MKLRYNKNYKVPLDIHNWAKTAEPYHTTEIKPFDYAGRRYTYMYLASRYGISVICLGKYRGWSPLVELTLDAADELNIQLRS